MDTGSDKARTRGKLLRARSTVAVAQGQLTSAKGHMRPEVDREIDALRVHLQREYDEITGLIETLQ